jgi:hypothetical protein
MNILPPIQPQHDGRLWPVVCCAWCGDDLNANDNLGSWDVRQHFAECALFLASEPGYNWQATDEGKRFIAGAKGDRTP